MKKYRYLVSPLAKVESNKEYIPYFSFGDRLKENYEAAQANVQIVFNVEKDITRPTGLTKKFHNSYGSEDGDEVYFERKLGLGLRGKLHIKKVLTNPEITANSAYHRFVRVKVDNLYPPGVHLGDVLSVNLLERGFVPLHCGAVASEKEAFLFTAPPDTGKSITTLLALKRGFHYLSEDISIVDEQSVYSNPNTSTFLHYGEEDNHKGLRSWICNIPLLEYYINPSKKSISEGIKNFTVDESAKIKRIFILDRGKESTIEKIDAEEALRRILIINRNEFSYHKNPLLFAYSYFQPCLNIDKLMKTEERILREIVEKTESFLVRTADPRQYIDLVMKS
jgi:hypothetical protein